MDSEKSIHIEYPDVFEEKKRKFIEEGSSLLQVFSDFDRTISKAMHQGKECLSSYGVTEFSGLLSDEYHVKIRGLFNKFYPIEISHELSHEEKTPFMEEWWNNANELLIKENVHISLIQKMVEIAYIEFREKTRETFELLEKENVPTIIFTAGIRDIVEKLILFKEGRYYSNMKMIGNHFILDENGFVVDFCHPTIHVFNKNVNAVKNQIGDNYFENIFLKRKNVIVIGDSTGDSEMVDGFEDLNTLKIGFLNTFSEEKFNIYKEIFDVLILNDGTFDFVYDLISDIVSKND